ncbi:hydantoinase/oxoprolinase family protein [Acidisphaera sp. L21]|uniref:hydantoinase/oxoprolinase family protein n=1 Tax=Acidisphaera sp. L21 TaxID=1641851 RepID=UPI00131A642F|nr:hydantoinase/oxoprolinase family protein [Acidisphaera sp. L21]
MSIATHWLGIDIGGTFTDVVLYDTAGGTSVSLKVLTTPGDPQRAVLRAVREMLERAALPASAIGRVVHATTLFTNALIERRGAVTGLITTEGFRDTLEIGRERKYDLYDIAIENPAPLVPRALRQEVAERIGPDGDVIVPLDLADLRAKLRVLQDAGVASVAIMFLHSYADPTHEKMAARAIAEWAPGLPVTPSHEVAPEIREYDRASTTVASAYVKPLAARYLQSLSDELAAIGVTAPLLLMLSNGGLTHIGEVIRNPVQMLESGPAAGALAAAFFGARDDCSELLGFDMGGTTAKLSLVEGGEPLIAYGFEAGRQKRFMEGSGLPIRISTVELIEIGAGGGSIARADALGLLKVGPDSAGSEPGPVCYGQGGTQPTVTDANLLLGYLNPDFFAGGTIHIDVAQADAAMRMLAERLGLTRDQAASGIHTLVNETMAGAARVHIAEHGRDPRGYALLVTGGGGPVHGYGVAKRLGITRLICPPSPGVASAWGLLVAPARVDRVRTITFPVQTGDLAALEAAYVALERDASQVVADAGLGTAPLVQRLADGRYVGQGFALVVPLPPGPYDSDDSRAALTAAFEVEYRRKFARSPPDVTLEFIAARVAVRTPAHDGDLAGLAAEAGGAVKAHRPAWFAEAGGFVDTPVYDRTRMAAGDTFSGPALVEDPGSTLVIGPGGQCRVSQSGSILVELA